MLTTTHAIWSLAIFKCFVKSKYEMIAIIVAAVIADVEIIFWVGMSLGDRLFNINPFGIDYSELLFGTGISFYYWPITLVTNSILASSVLVVLLGLVFRRGIRIYLVLWLVIQFHILLDALTHEAGNMLFWPLSSKKYLGVFEYSHLPVWAIVAEQALSFALLFWILFYRKGPTREHALNEN